VEGRATEYVLVKNIPTFSTILKICSVLEITLFTLFSIYDKKNPDFREKKWEP
jgi:DNA-binding Xre family transcriptional regulator